MYKEAIAVFKSVTSVKFHPRILKEVSRYNNNTFYCSFGGAMSMVCWQMFNNELPAKQFCTDIYISHIVNFKFDRYRLVYNLQKNKISTILYHNFHIANSFINFCQTFLPGENLWLQLTGEYSSNMNVCWDFILH